MSLRETFPCGLFQPEGAFRSSADALLLAGFAAACVSPPSRKGKDKPPPLFVELGAGCGMASCALALHAPHAVGVGVEVQPELVEAARRNVSALDLDAQLRMLAADVGNLATLRQGCALEAASLVMANPPYGVQGQGRQSPQALRQAALHGEPDTLHLFCRAARALLRHHGHCCMVFTATRLGDLLAQLRQNGLGTRLLRCVYTRPGRHASLVLVAARKNAAEDIRIAPPLTLHAHAEGGHYTAEARRWLFQKE